MRPSKKTTTTLNRFITFTRSWWAKSAFLLSILALFFSCQEDLNYLGFKSNQKRFKVIYAEIPVESSVLWMDSLRTTSLSGELNRMMFGKYVDPVFGSIETKAFSQFRPGNSATAIPSTAVYDSVVLQLRYDFYTYGTTGETTQSLAVHEITTALDFDTDYFFNSDVSISRFPLGTAEARVNADYFKTEYEDTNADSIVTIKIKLSNAFGNRLFDAVNPEDTLYSNLAYFTEQFKGLAITTTQSDKVVGVNNFDTNTFLALYYHDGDTKKTLSFPLSGLITFTKVIANRSGTELDGLNSFFTDFNQNNNRYVQGGSSIVTKIDLSKYYEYIDSIPDIVINSAEFAISGAESTAEFQAPKNLSLVRLRPNNRYKFMETKQDTLDFIAFNGSLVISDLGKLFVANDTGGLLSLPHSSTEQNYIGYPTIFFQKLFDLKATQYPYWALVPMDPPQGKSVNRTIFSKDNIKLKIYYTRPTFNENP